MSRERKFRGIDIKTGLMVFGGGLDSQRDTTIIINHGEKHFVDSKTVGDFTGLTDKNGKEIYEGDIVKHASAHFDDNGCCHTEFHASSEVFITKVDGVVFGRIPYRKCGNIEVIGNIHENPELLGA